jgi:hypothetical protein
VIGYVALKPDKTPLGIYSDMGEAQGAIAIDEPCIIKQGLYQIHPIRTPRDAEALKLNLHWKIEIEKRDGDDQSQPPVETVVREGVN